MDLAEFTRWAWYLGLVVQWGLTVKLWRLGFASKWRYLWLGLLVSGIRELVLIAVPYQANSYALWWMGTQPLVWVAYVLMTLELYSAILKDYPGLATYGRFVMLVGLAVGIGVSLSMVSLDFSNPDEPYPILRYFFAVERAVTFGLLLFLLVALFFLRKFPISLTRNTAVHAFLLTLFFTSAALMFFYRNLTGLEFKPWLNLIAAGLNLSCMVTWLVAFTPAGEEARTVVLARVSAEEERELLQQLEKINQILEDTLKK